MAYDPSPTAFRDFEISGQKCLFCFLNWQKYENGHLHPDNLGWVECKAMSPEANKPQTLTESEA